MSTRITTADLERLVRRINDFTGSPKEPYREVQGRYVAQVGNYHLSGAYGGYCLHRMYNDAGGVTTPLGGGHRPKKELYYQLGAFLAGIEAGHE